jgi:diaminohydroxyphosphoribosylaminopyrimidine deaminase/5-amino-6-(5-phosphoribosylamino)uracil reductase
MSTIHEKYMTRCLQLAKLGEGHTAPNPMVGCVIVYKGKIIGEGFHQKYGEPHAEVNAIGSVVDKSLLEHSEIYVNLEPCSHFGKTPPCADLIIKNKIPTVFIGTLDPNPVVSGNGYKKLIAAGCNVEVGVLKEECKKLNRRFFTFQEKKRPYIILKWAQTQDGFVDTLRHKTEHGQPTWITDEIARIAVHKQRSTEAAVLIGTNTALKDNPSLTLRDWHGNQPKRVVFDLNHRLPSSLNIFNGETPTITFSGNEYLDKRETEYLLMKEHDSIGTMLTGLFNSQIQSIIVEGGPVTLQRFIDLNYWDEAHVYTGNKSFNEGIKAPIFNADPVQGTKFRNSTLAVYLNNNV